MPPGLQQPLGGEMLFIEAWRGLRCMGNRVEIPTSKLLEVQLAFL